MTTKRQSKAPSRVHNNDDALRPRWQLSSGSLAMPSELDAAFFSIETQLAVGYGSDQVALSVARVLRAARQALRIERNSEDATRIARAMTEAARRLEAAGAKTTKAAHPLDAYPTADTDVAAIVANELFGFLFKADWNNKDSRLVVASEAAVIIAFCRARGAQRIFPFLPPTSDLVEQISKLLDDRDGQRSSKKTMQLAQALVRRVAKLSGRQREDRLFA